jgi:hypothetical protein
VVYSDISDNQDKRLVRYSQDSSDWSIEAMIVHDFASSIEIIMLR